MLDTWQLRIIWSALDGGHDANGVDVDVDVDVDGDGDGDGDGDVGDGDGDVGDQIVHALVLGVLTEQQSQKPGWWWHDNSRDGQGGIYIFD